MPRLPRCSTCLQSIGKVPVDVRQLGVDMLTIVSAFGRSLLMFGACKVGKAACSLHALSCMPASSASRLQLWPTDY